MNLITAKKEDIIDKLDELSPENLAEVQAFIEFLRFKSNKEPKQVIQLGGLWKDMLPLTEEEIAEARRDMWGSFGEREI